MLNLRRNIITIVLDNRLEFCDSSLSITFALVYCHENDTFKKNLKNEKKTRILR